ncbi:hypothetical protein [Frigidibacter sp. ROC022]|uniref:hypothetical protein n=1 Tax=Frigidibacter sp. ROC022 TaxID=2971796 RepID=UPI00215B055D|nr:hypothetical protein [Frigidibacter sp. ROC022]MCR8726654.1 hypothetical protein [Frigidibacter sp. ROC022]
MARPHSRARHFRNSPPLLTGLLGLATLFAGFVYWPAGIGGSAELHYNLFLLSVFAVMAISDLVLFQTWRQPEAGVTLAPTRPDGAVWTRIAVKLVGLGALLLGAATLYATVPLYLSPWYQRFTLQVFDNAVPIALGLAAYVVLADRLLTEPHDQLHAFGTWVCSLGTTGDPQKIGDFLRASAVKFFFLPLMYCYGLDDWIFFREASGDFQSFTAFYEYAYRYLFFVDVCFAIIGYAVATRLLGAHVRWAERGVKGWLVCLICYAPFWQVIGREYLAYDDDIVWGSLLKAHPLAYQLWGSMILLLLCLYVLSTVSFGIRFSNVTYRGTVHRGPYALLRHPAYVSKNLTMWLIQLPFLAVSPLDALGNTLALIGINTIYFLRARTEEANCSGAREYRLYKRYMRRHGPVARMLVPLRRGGGARPGRFVES